MNEKIIYSDTVKVAFDKVNDVIDSVNNVETDIDTMVSHEVIPIDQDEPTEDILLGIKRYLRDKSGNILLPFTSAKGVILSDGVSNADDKIAELSEGVESNRQYTDSQISIITSTGIPKLVSYSYYIYATVDNQMVFEIPYEYFTSVTDTLMVFFDGIFRPTTDYVITNPIEVEGVITKGHITLNIGRPIDSYVGLMILKNVPIGEDGSIRGGVIAVDSMPQDRVTGLVEALNNLNTFNTTTDGRLDDIEGELLDSTITTPTISYGMNSKITNTGKTYASPKFTIQGKTVVNLLGKDGNCEDVSRWALSTGTAVLDTNNKVFGSSSIKVTATSAYSGIFNPLSKWNIDITKYYFISAYLKNGTAGYVYLNKDTGGGSGTGVCSTAVTDTTKFVRVGIKVKPSDMASTNNIYAYSYLSGSSGGQYAYFDGIMATEITVDEYNNLSTDQLLAKYPYVDSYSCLQNPYIEIRHDNLVRNGNGEEGIGWWTPNATGTPAPVFTSLQNGFKLVSTTVVGSYLQNIKVKPNTDYYLSGNVTGDNIVINDISNTIRIRTGVGTFNTGNNTEIILYLQNQYTSTTCTYDHIMLVEGTVAPPSYKPCRIERTVIEGKFTSDDSLTYDNGEVSGLINWKHKTLFGKDYNWSYGSDYAGYKYAYIPNADIPNIYYASPDAETEPDVIVKYDGKILANKIMFSIYGADAYNINNTQLAISLSDTDTGWAESINPNSDEVKAFMNGWKSVQNNGTRYIAWLSLLDGSLPSASLQQTIATVTTASSTVTVPNGTAFTIGDTLGIIRQGTLMPYFLASSVITAVTSTTVTISTPWTTQVGDVVFRCDNASTNVSLLNYCKNNVAPNYEGYQLHYKLANPEPITDINTSISGDIPKFDVGDNYLYLDSGIVLGEVANQKSDGSYYYINDIFAGYEATRFKYKDEIINNIFKNSIYDNTNWLFGTSNGYGNQMARILVSNFDTNAIYTVDYKILATQAPQIGSIGCSYSQDIVSAISDLNEKVESRQVHDSALDTLVDLSLYEVISRNLYWFFYKTSSKLYVNAFIPLSYKKCVPNITVKNIKFYISDVDCTSKFLVDYPRISASGINLVYYTTDSTTISNVIANGLMSPSPTIIADCTGRI